MFLCMILSICLCFQSISCTVFIPIELNHGKRIANGIIDIITNVDFATCETECKTRGRCLSINYSPFWGLCELSSLSSSYCRECIQFDPRFVTSEKVKWNMDNPLVCNPSNCAIYEKCSLSEYGSTECSVADCGIPSRYTLQYYFPSTIGIGSKTSYQCIRGYHGHGGGRIACQENGQWTKNYQSCEIVDCLEPPAIENAIINVSSTIYGSVATVECKDEYESAMDSHQQDSIICQEDGTWEMSNFTCVWMLGCSSTDLHDHPSCASLLFWSGNKTGDYANYSAAAEYGKESRGPYKQVICGNNRQWDPLAITCSKSLVCDDIYLLSPGIFSISSSDLISLVYCELRQSPLSGKWTVIQRRSTGLVDFDRDWQSYKIGFGNAMSDYWLGNDMIHQITASGDFRVAFVLTDQEGTEKYALYETFSVGPESDNYRLTIGGYVALENDAGEAMMSHNNKMFTTRDRDNDHYSNNCAVLYPGGWWYFQCYTANLNGAQRIHWGSYISLSESIIMVQRKTLVNDRTFQTMI